MKIVCSHCYEEEVVIRDDDLDAECARLEESGWLVPMRGYREPRMLWYCPKCFQELIDSYYDEE